MHLHAWVARGSAGLKKPEDGQAGFGFQVSTYKGGYHLYNVYNDIIITDKVKHKFRPAPKINL